MISVFKNEFVKVTASRANLVALLVIAPVAFALVFDPVSALGWNQTNKTSMTNETNETDETDEKGTPVVTFNHLYVVVSAEVMAQFTQSEVLRDRIAASDQGFPRFEPVESGSQTIYLRGKNTYLEFFGPDNRFGEPVGKLGLAFSTEVAGEIDEVEERLRQTEGTSQAGWQRHLTEWNFERESPVNWYHLVYRKFAPESRCVWWFSEFHPDFLPALFPDRPARETGIKRSQFLSARHDKDLWMRDVSTVVAALSPSAAEELVADLSAVGGSVLARKDGGRELSLGSEFQIVLYVSDQDSTIGVRSIGFSTYPQSDGPMRQEFEGGVTLRLDGANQGWIEF